MDESLRQVLDRLEIGRRDTSQVSDAEAAFLFELVRAEEPASTLEIGCGLGKSAVAIMLASGGRHTVVDPFQQNYDRRGITNIEGAGFGDRLDFIADFSHTALPALLAAGRRFDLVFVDGSHRFDDIFVDFYYSDLLLQPGGVIVFDDLWMRTSQLVLAYVRTNRPDYTALEGTPRGFAAVRKTGQDDRNGMFHREFYTGRGLVTHHAVPWLASGDSPVKRSARWLKAAAFR